MNWIDQEILGQLSQDVGDELLPQLVTIFIEDGQKNLAELDQALERRDAEKLLLLAHTMKSVCATYGATLCHCDAQQLERACRQLDWQQISQRVAVLHTSVQASNQALAELVAEPHLS